MTDIPKIDCRTTTGNIRCKFLTEYKRSPESKVFVYRNMFVCEFMRIVLEHKTDLNDTVNRTITSIEAPWDCAVRQLLRKEDKHPKVITIG